MPLNRIKLVDFALDQAGLDQGFRSKARLWLNHAIEKLSIRTDYKFYSKVADISLPAGSDSADLPNDFQRPNTAYLVSQNQLQNQIWIVEDYVFDQRRSLSQGDPEVAIVDLDAQKLVVNRPASATRLIRLRYQRVPDQLSEDATDDLVIPDFEDQDTLLEELIKYCYRYRDDERQQIQEQLVEKSKQEFQRNMIPADNLSRIELAQDVFIKRRRR